MAQLELLDLTRVLGGKRVIRREVRTDIDLIALGDQGLSKTALDNLAKFLALSLAQMAALLSLSERTLQRYDAKTRFNRLVSEHILHIAEVAVKGVDVFEDKSLFLKWLHHPNIALGNTPPIDLLKSRFGANMILQELGRMEHGVLS